MIGDPLKKVTTGQPFVPSAASWNAFADAARAHLERQVNSVKPYLSVGGNGQTLALVHNSGADVARFGVLSISNAIFDPGASATLADFQNALTFDCTDIDPSTSGYVITLEPIRNNECGMAVLAGAVQCQVNMNSSQHHYASPCQGESDRLESSCEGSARILWAKAGTGLQWAVVRLGSSITAFLVWLTQDGGTSGGGGTSCSWTYTVSDPSNTSVPLKQDFSGTPATSMTPAKARTANDAYFSGGSNYGWAIRNEYGQMILLEALGEVIQYYCLPGGV
jgi:hypothetical protein